MVKIQHLYSLKISRILISMIITSALVGYFVYNAIPVSAFSVDFTEPSSNRLGDTIAFSTAVNINNGEMLPIEYIDLMIYNQDDSIGYNLSCSHLPLTSDTRTYSTAGGPVTVTAIPESTWWHGYGYRNANWEGNQYDWGYGYGYGNENGSGTTSITYLVTWESSTTWLAGEYDIKLKIHANGSTFSKINSCKFATLATIDIDPETLNKHRKGKWITCYIELPEGYDVASIDANSVLLNGEVKPELNHKHGFVKSPDGYLMDHDGDGIMERMFKFDKSEVASVLDAGDEVEVTITGKVDGLRFEGSDIIKVIGDDHDCHGKTWKSRFTKFSNRHFGFMGKPFLWFLRFF